MAKAFQFSLQKVLDVREHRERQKSIALGKAQTEMQHVQQKLEQFKDKKKSFLVDEEQSEIGTSDLQTIRIKAGYIHQLNTNIDRKNKELKQKQNKVGQKRNELLHALKDKKIVQKLKEHKQEEHKQDIRRSDAKRDNEVAARLVNQNRQNS